MIRKRKKLVENAPVNIPAYPQNDTEEFIGKCLALANAGQACVARAQIVSISKENQKGTTAAQLI